MVPCDAAFDTALAQTLCPDRDCKCQGDTIPFTQSSSHIIAYANPQIPLLNTVKYNPLSYPTEPRFSFDFYFFLIIILARGPCFVVSPVKEDSSVPTLP